MGAQQGDGVLNPGDGVPGPSLPPPKPERRLIPIRLETRDGRLYDSHGIDHTLLLCVKMYGPGSSTATPVDLYPGYTPDMRQALVRKLERERC